MGMAQKADLKAGRMAIIRAVPQRGYSLQANVTKDESDAVKRVYAKRILAGNPARSMSDLLRELLMANEEVKQALDEVRVEAKKGKGAGKPEGGGK